MPQKEAPLGNGGASLGKWRGFDCQKQELKQGFGGMSSAWGFPVQISSFIFVNTKVSENGPLLGPLRPLQDPIWQFGTFWGSFWEPWNLTSSQLECNFDGPEKLALNLDSSGSLLSSLFKTVIFDKMTLFGISTIVDLILYRILCTPFWSGVR